MRAAAGFSLLTLLSLAARPASAQQPRPAVEMMPEGYGPPTEENVADSEAAQRQQRLVEGNIDYDVSYDDSVAQTYDDGYDPQAAAQFDETLAPYGNWVDDDVYGRVWQPAAEAVGDDFSPYATGGRWTLTEYGWTWISDWDWGWAPFHYGRWLAIADRGWCWMPGTLWGPAWVAWRTGGGYVGWAPLAPRRISVGSPLGAGSPWRFALTADMGHSRGFIQPQQVASRIFGRMTVVSNPHALPIPGARVRVNAGPIFAGMPPVSGAANSPTRLAAVAPRALPRQVIEPHPGTPAAMRPWIRGGGRIADSSDGRNTPGDSRPGSVGETPAVRRGSAPPRAFPAGAAPANRRAPMIHGAPSSMITRTPPGYRGPTYRVAPAIAPRPWAGTPTRISAPIDSRTSFSGSRFYGNGYSFSGGSSMGNRSAARGSSFGNGSSSGGRGSSFGGGRRR